MFLCFYVFMFLCFYVFMFLCFYVIGAFPILICYQKFFLWFSQTLSVTHFFCASPKKIRNSTQHTTILISSGNSSQSSQSCAPRITFSFFILPIGTIQRRQGGPLGGTLGTGRISSEVSLLRSAVVGIKKFCGLLWFHWIYHLLLGKTEICSFQTRSHSVLLMGTNSLTDSAKLSSSSVVNLKPLFPRTMVIECGRFFCGCDTQIFSPGQPVWGIHQTFVFVIFLHSN